MYENILAKHMRNPLALAIITACLAASPVLSASAQDQPPQDQSSEDAANLATITVTGSRIKRSSVETAQPVIRISHQQLEASGLKNVGQILTNLPSVGYVSGGFASSSFSGTGSAQISMHHLGSNRVLVLLNGHRMAAGFGGAVDMNQIPIAAIERIEVLQDGASAVYGSDAIAGVVNIITKKHYSGTVLSAYAGASNGSGHWDGHQQQFSLVTGLSNDRGHIMFAASVRRREAIPTWHRDFSSYDPVLGNTRGSSYTPQGRFIFNPPSGGDPTQPGNSPAAYTGLTSAQCPNNMVQYGGQTLYLPHCDLTIIKGRSGQSADDYKQFTPQDRYVGIGAGTRRHRSSHSDNTLTTNQDIKSIYTQGGYDILPSLTATFSALYTRRNTHANRVTGFGGASDAESFIGANNPYNPFNFPLSAADPVEVAPGVYRPTLVAIYRKMNEGGLRNRIHESRTFRISGGLKGNFNLGDSFWNWDAGYIYSTNRIVSAQTNTYSSLAMALATSPQCSQIPGCVPVNWFGGQGVDGKGSITPEQLAYIGIKHDILGISTKHYRSWSANLSTANLFELPAGGLGVAVGAQHRNISGLSVPDPSGVTPSLRNTTPSKVLQGSYDVDSAYAEVNVPILADLPGVKRLSVDVAGRYSRYSTFGNTTNARFAVSYQPFQDLLLRASRSEGFRAANISEMFSPAYTDFPYVEDPCDNYSASGVSATVQQNCSAHGVPASYGQSFGQLTARYGGNPDLEPETSISKTLGAVYSPSWLPGFSINADYYHIELKHTIGSVSSQQIFNFCYRGGVERYCNLIHRQPSGTVVRIDNLTTNIGGTTVSGVDFGVYYRLPTSFGQFNFMARASRTNYYNIYTPRGDGTVNTVQVVGDLDNGNIPRWKGNFRVTYTGGPWTANVTAHYLGAIGNGQCTDYLDGTPLSLANLGYCSNPNLTDNSKSTNGRTPLVWWDLQVAYQTPWNVDLQVGVNNAFGAEPKAGREGYGYQEALDYGVLSRYLYAQVTYRFGGSD